MEKHITRKKIFGLVEQTSQMEMEVLKKEEALIQKNIDENKKLILEKQKKAESVSSNMLLQAKEGSLDVGLLAQCRDYLVLLEDELIKDRLVSKSLDRRHKTQLSKINQKYQEAKLYQKMLDKSNTEIQLGKMKIEEKEQESLASQTNKGRLSYD